MSKKSGFNDWVKTFCDYEDLSVYELDIMQAAWVASANRDGCKLVSVDTLLEITKYATLCAKSHGNEIIEEKCKALIGDEK